MPGRALLGLVVIAALVGAPSRAFADGNDRPDPADGGPTAPVAGQREEEADGNPANGGPLSAVLVAGLAGVGAVALIGTAILLAGRRRQRRSEGAVPSAAGETAALLERRMVRRARMRMDEDPILAAMGIGADDEPRRARRPASKATARPRERQGRTPPT